VGEWLKPADCKSAPPCEVRRFESFPVHHEFVEKRLLIALAAYVALAALAFATLPDQRVRGVTLVILAMFAVKTWVRRKDVMHPGNGSSED
jgi:hypothetical protein